MDDTITKSKSLNVSTSNALSPFKQKKKETTIDSNHYFNLLFKYQRLDIDKSILYNGFASFIDNLNSKLPKKQSKQSLELIKDLILSLTFQQLDNNHLLFRYGDKAINVPVILSGTIDLIVPLENKTRLFETEYLTYLALLIEYEEYELVNRVLSENINEYYLEILNTKGYGMVANGLKKGYGASKYIQLEKLKEYLSEEEREYCKRQFKSNRNIDKGHYIALFNYNKRFMTRNVKDKEIEVKLLEYKHVATLHPGEILGEYQMSHSYRNINKYKATFITSSTNVSIGNIPMNVYTNTIKSLIEKAKQKKSDFITFYSLFKDIPIETFANKYLHLFQYYKSESKDNEDHNNIHTDNSTSNFKLIKKGEFTIITKQSISELPSFINILYKRIIQLQSAITSPLSSSSSIPRINCKELKSKVDEINERNEMLSEKIEDGIINESGYSEKKILKILTIEPREIIGFDLFTQCSKMYHLKSNSKVTEYYLLNKSIYNQIRDNEPSIQKAENEFLIKKITVILNRLLNIYKGKSHLILMNHENDKRNKIDNPTNEMIKVQRELSNPKIISKNEKSLTNILNKDSIKDFFTRIKTQKELCLNPEQHSYKSNYSIKKHFVKKQTEKVYQYSTITTAKDISTNSSFVAKTSSQYPKLLKQKKHSNTSKSTSLNISFMNEGKTHNKNSSGLLSNKSNEVPKQYVHEKYFPSISTLNKSVSFLVLDNSTKNVSPSVSKPHFNLGSKTMNQSNSMYLHFKTNTKKKAIVNQKTSLYVSGYPLV